VKETNMIDEPLRSNLPALPVRIAPLYNRKYYATVVVDSAGAEVLRVSPDTCRQWGDLSPRETAQGTDPADLCDGHWEDTATWLRAAALVHAINAAGGVETTRDLTDR
jgi:hypothetical protein